MTISPLGTTSEIVGCESYTPAHASTNLGSSTSYTPGTHSDTSNPQNILSQSGLSILSAGSGTARTQAADGNNEGPPQRRTLTSTRVEPGCVSVGIGSKTTDTGDSSTSRECDLSSATEMDVRIGGEDWDETSFEFHSLRKPTYVA